MNNKSLLAHAAFAISSFAWLDAACAAGGHHGVDDASILDPGQCQFEVWAEHSSAYRLTHAGPACRVGPVEAGIGMDRRTDSGSASTSTLWSPQIKWATPLGDELAVGAVWTLTWQSPAPRQTTHALLLPVSWQPRPSLAFHLNVGRDFPKDGNSVTRRGAAVEWQPHPRWQGLAEWLDDGLRANRRLGLRFSVNNKMSLDLAQARWMDPPHNPWWTLGLNWTFQ